MSISIKHNSSVFKSLSKVLRTSATKALCKKAKRSPSKKTYLGG